MEQSGMKSCLSSRAFDQTIPYMEAGKCYNYTLEKTENPKVVKKLFVSSVQRHTLIGTNEVYNYSYWVTTVCDTSDLLDCGMYIFNSLGGYSSSNYYCVKNCSIVEMTPTEAVEFVKQLKSKWAREKYLGENPKTTMKHQQPTTPKR